jgi:hypothetical protein
MLLKISQRTVPTIGVMHDIALRYIFDRPSVSRLEQIALEEGIEAWSKKVDLEPEDKWEIRRIVNALCADEVGHFNRAKELIRKNNLHYRQLYSKGLPYIPNPDKCRTFGRG